MPKFLEEKLEKEYPDNPHAVFGTMNKLGVMKGNKETAKGRKEEKEHEKKKESVAKKMKYVKSKGLSGFPRYTRINNYKDK